MEDQIRYYSSYRGLEVRILENYRFDKKSGGMIWDSELVGIIPDEEMIELIKNSPRLLRREGYNPYKEKNNE